MGGRMRGTSAGRGVTRGGVQRSRLRGCACASSSRICAAPSSELAFGFAVWLAPPLPARSARLWLVRFLPPGPPPPALVAGRAALGRFLFPERTNLALSLLSPPLPLPSLFFCRASAPPLRSRPQTFPLFPADVSSLPPPSSFAAMDTSTTFEVLDKEDPEGTLLSSVTGATTTCELLASGDVVVSLTLRMGDETLSTDATYGRYGLQAVSDKGLRIEAWTSGPAAAVISSANKFASVALSTCPAAVTTAMVAANLVAAIAATAQTPGSLPTISAAMTGQSIATTATTAPDPTRAYPSIFWKEAWFTGSSSGTICLALKPLAAAAVLLGLDPTDSDSAIAAALAAAKGVGSSSDGMTTWKDASLVWLSATTTAPTSLGGSISTAAQLSAQMSSLATWLTAVWGASPKSIASTAAYAMVSASLAAAEAADVARSEAAATLFGERQKLRLRADAALHAAAVPAARMVVPGAKTRFFPGRPVVRRLGPAAAAAAAARDRAGALPAPTAPPAGRPPRHAEDDSEYDAVTGETLPGPSGRDPWANGGDDAPKALRPARASPAAAEVHNNPLQSLIEATEAAARALASSVAGALDRADRDIGAVGSSGRLEEPLLDEAPSSSQPSTGRAAAAAGRARSPAPGEEEERPTRPGTPSAAARRVAAAPPRARAPGAAGDVALGSGPGVARNSCAETAEPWSEQDTFCNPLLELQGTFAGAAPGAPDADRAASPPPRASRSPAPTRRPDSALADARMEPPASPREFSRGPSRPASPGHATGADDQPYYVSPIAQMSSRLEPSPFASPTAPRSPASSERGGVGPGFGPHAGTASGQFRVDVAMPGAQPETLAQGSYNVAYCFCCCFPRRRQ